MRMHGAGDQRRGGISRREGGREGGGQRKEAKGVIVNFTWRHATRGSRALSFPPSLLPSLLPSYTTHDVANYAIKAACKFLPLFTKGGGGGGGSWRDKEGGKSQDNNLFVKIAESGKNALPPPPTVGEIRSERKGK